MTLPLPSKRINYTTEAEDWRDVKKKKKHTRVIGIFLRILAIKMPPESLVVRRVKCEVVEEGCLNG